MNQEPNYKHYTRGGQILFHNLRMWDQITKTLLTLCMVAWVVLTCLLTWYRMGRDALQQTLSFYFARFLDFTGFKHQFEIPYQGHVYHQDVHALVTHPFYRKTAKDCFDALIHSGLIAAVAALVLAGVLAFYFVRKGRSQTDNQFIRGSVLASSKRVKKQIQKDALASDIIIDGFPLIKNSEVQHLLVHGTVGTGKSQLIMKILDALRKRGDRVIVYDKGCALAPVYFKEETDVILNPFDERCAHWDMWEEAPRDSDFENMAESLIPMHGESDPFWVNAARTVFASAACKMRHDPERSEEKLLKLLVTGEFENLESYLQGTPAATLTSGKI